MLLCRKRGRERGGWKARESENGREGKGRAETEEARGMAEGEKGMAEWELNGWLAAKRA
jgi:hypothetical protein